MKVTIIDGDVSYPPTSGKRLRTLNLLLPLAARHKLTYIARGNGDRAADRVAEDFFRGRGIEPVIVDDPIAKKKGVGFYARLAWNLLSPLPYSVASHGSEKMRRAVADHASKDNPDLYQVEWTGYLDCVPPGPTPIVLQAHNVDTLIWQRYEQTETHRLKKWYIRAQHLKMRRFEQAAFRRASRIVAVSLPDAMLAREWFGVENIDVVDNGVDVKSFGAVRPDPASRCIIYLGALDWRPNLDALGWLMDAIFPMVRAKVPDAKLLIVGRSPPAWLKKRSLETGGVELHADVPDVKPFLAKSAVMAVTLRIGGGSRLKILESLAAGVPVVSTSVGAEGLELHPGGEYIQADTATAMAEALAESLANPGPSIARAERGRELVAQRYDWPMLAERLERVWGRAVG